MQLDSAAKFAGSELASRMGLTQVRGVDDLQPEKFVLIASSEGIQMGTLKTREMTNMHYTAYKLNGTKIFEKRYLFHGKLGLDKTPTTNLFIAEEADIYTA